MTPAQRLALHDGPLSERVRAFRVLTIREELARHGGNITAAARTLGMQRTNLQRLIRENAIIFRRTHPPSLRAFQGRQGRQGRQARLADSRQVAMRLLKTC